MVLKVQNRNHSKSQLKNFLISNGVRFREFVFQATTVFGIGKNNATKNFTKKSK